MNNQIVVVEGIHDKDKVLKAFNDLTVLTTGGSAISDEFIIQLKTLSKTNEIILLLDPDYPGNKIRQTIISHIPEALNAHIDRKDCMDNKGKVGIEHASINVIKEALSMVRKRKENSDITKEFLIDLKYLGAPNSKTKRDFLLNKLNLGKANGKTFMKLLKSYGITKDEVLSYET